LPEADGDPSRSARREPHGLKFPEKNGSPGNPAPLADNAGVLAATLPQRREPRLHNGYREPGSGKAVKPTLPSEITGPGIGQTLFEAYKNYALDREKKFFPIIIKYYNIVIPIKYSNNIQDMDLLYEDFLPRCF
jgi:hypothetical protein